MRVRTETLRIGLMVALVVASVVALGSLGSGATQAAGPYVAVQQDAATFENGTVVEQRGDVAEFTVLFGETDRANVTIGSPDVNYQVTFTVADGDGDGEATVRINTAVAGLQGDDKRGISADGADGIINYEMATDPIPGPLDAATYNMELKVDGEIVAVGAIVLNERSTEGISVWTAPAEASPNNTTALFDVITRDDRIAQQDWAVLQVETSGLYGYVDNISDLNNPDYGLNLTFTTVPGRNQPGQPVELEPEQVLTDSTNDSLFVLVNTSDLTVDMEYEATFSINDSNPYVEEGENESVSTTFTVVERNVTFENLADGQLELPAESDATVSGNTSVAPGTVMEVQLRTWGAGAFLRDGQATVADDGTWSVTFDLSEASNGTEFELWTDDPSANVSGVIVERGATAEGTETPTNETETPATETETPEGEETTPGDETDTPADEETPTAEGDMEAGETTTEADVSNVLSAGGTAGHSLGLVALLAAAFVVLRRR